MEPVELLPITVYPPGQEPPADPVNIPLPSESTQPVLLPIAQQRGSKADLGGIGTLVNKTPDEMVRDIQAGRESALRDQAAAAQNIQRMKEKTAQVSQMAQTYGPLSSEQVARVMDPFSPQNQPSDPDTVIEKNYARSYIGTLATAPAFLGTDNVFDTAARELPKQVTDTEDVANDLTTKNQYLLKKLQEAQQTVSQQSWFDWGLDQLKGITQIYPEAKERGLIDKTYGVGGLGSNLEEQSNLLYRKPLPEFKETVDKVAAGLMKDNPSLAVQFLQDMYGQDTFEKVTNNVFTAMAIPDIALGTKLVQKVLLYNQVRKAAKDMVEAASKDVNPSPSSLVGAAGDTQESAVLRTADQVVKAMDGTGNPIQTAQQTLLTPWKQFTTNFRSNPGVDLSREAEVRILDGLDKDMSELVNRITVMNRVDRLPRAQTSQEVIRAYKDKIKQDYKGPNSMVLDVDGPILEPVSNTKWFKIKLGDYDASLFPDQATAEGRAATIGAKTVEGQAGEKVYLPKAAATKIESIKTKDGSTKFFIDNGIEVQASPTPQPGTIPYNLKTSQFEKELTAESARVEQQGLGFYITHWVPMKETDNVLRDLMIRDIHGNIVPETVSTSTASGTKSIINSVLGWVRNSDQTLAVQESAQRKAVVYSKANIERWAADLNKPIAKVKNQGVWWKPTAYLGKTTGKDVSSQFERALDNARQTQAWFKNVTDMKDFYLRNFSRTPSPLEQQAYFNYVKLIEGDRILGEVAEFRNRARVGAEQHRLRFIGADGKPIFSDLFDGVTLSRLPSNSDQVLIAGDKPESIKEASRFDSKTRAKFDESISKGQLKLIELYDLDHYPLGNLSDLTKGERIRYVLAKNVETNPISFNHVNKKEGGHFDWDYDHYLKQADMREQKSGKHIYVGDTTIMPIDSRALGGKIIKLWNEAQDHIKRNDWEGAKPLVAKMGVKWEDFTGWYKAGRDDLGREIRPKLNPNEPVYVVQKGKNILSIDDSLPERYKFKDKFGNTVNRFEDGSRTGFANNFKVAYNTERHTDFNFRTINDIGTQDNPIYAYQPAKLVDPLPTMNRALNRAINSAFMDDYKLYAMEHWLREAEEHLEADGGRNAIRSAPFWHYNNPSFKASTPLNVKWNLLSNKYKIDTFVGVPSKFDAWVHTFTEHLADVAYDAYGPAENRSMLQKARTITPIWLLQHVKNPIDFIRSVTFNFKLGLFSPAQFLVQAQTHALIWSLEPQHGTAGTFAMLLHGWSRVNKNPSILSALDNYATKLSGFGSRFKPGEWLEAMRELEKTGFEHVAGEYANLSKSYLPTTNFLQGDIEKGLKIGQAPFRLGEQSTRITAWYTAFRKFREENPTKAITNIERNEILNYADLLTVNMSRASSSVLSHGILSLSTQFLSYQIKLAELFWSKRIGETPAQRAMARARMLTGFALLYGMPNAIGVTGVPFSDNIREHLIDDLGYIPGEKWISSVVNEGFPAWTLAMSTGSIQNVGDRFGSQGWQNVKQGLRSDIPWWQAIGGAGVTTMSNFISAGLDPFYQGALSWARGDTGDSRFTVKSSDLVEPFKEISSVSSAAKFIAAMNTGKWINKNEAWVTDVTPARAALLAATGMNPQAQDDMFIQNQIVRGEEEAFKKAGKEFAKDWRRSVEAFKNNDPEQGNAYVANAMARLTVVGMPYEEVLKTMAMANQGLWESGVDAADYSYWLRGDRNKFEQRTDYFLRKKELNK